MPNNQTHAVSIDFSDSSMARFQSLRGAPAIAGAHCGEIGTGAHCGEIGTGAHCGEIGTGAHCGEIGTGAHCGD